MPPAPRPKPKPVASRSNPEQAKTLGRPSKKSRQQTNAAVEASDAARPDESPVMINGRPAVKIEMASQELIKTGDFSNVTVGPARITWWIDPQDPNPISDEERANVARSLNVIAEIVEVDVVAVQRNLVLEALQSNVE